jgi:uncharacterized membrane protein YfcA
MGSVEKSHAMGRHPRGVSALAVAAGAAVLTGAAVQSATGFGFALVAAPLLFAVFEPVEAVGLSLLLGIEVNLLTALTEGRRPRPLARDVGLILLLALPGMVAGVALLESLDEVVLQLAVSLGVLATLLVRRMRPASKAVPRWAAPAVGLSAGVLTTTTTTAGPPVLAYLLGRGLAPERIRDTLTVVFLGLGVLGAAVLLATGTDAAIPPPLVPLAAMAPAVVIGHVAGRPLFARLARGHYEGALTAVLVLAVAGGLLTALI